MTEVSGAPVPRRAEIGEGPADARWRLERVQRAIEASPFDAAVLSSEANFTYVTGYCTPAWAMTARPLAVVVSADRCTAVVGSAEAEPLGRACPDLDIATYTEPVIRTVDGFPLTDFAEAATDVVQRLLGGTRVGTLGIEGSVPSASGLPHSCVTRLGRELGADLRDVSALMWTLRVRKTPYEMERLCYVGHALGRMYGLFEASAQPGLTERELQCLVQRAASQVGVDRLAFSLIVAGAAEPGDGPPGTRIWQDGDLLFMDTCLVADGYWSDFSRHYAAGEVRREFTDAYERIVAATRAGRAACTVGTTAGAVTRAEAAQLPSPAPRGLASIGRMGHGIGLDLTEPPSLNVDDETVLLAGTTVTVEPLAAFDFGCLSAEEMVAVLDDGPMLLSPPFPGELGVLCRR